MRALLGEVRAALPLLTETALTARCPNGHSHASNDVNFPDSDGCPLLALVRLVSQWPGYSEHSKHRTLMPETSDHLTQSTLKRLSKAIHTSLEENVSMSLGEVSYFYTRS